MTAKFMRDALDEGGIHHARPVGKEFIFTADHGSHRDELWGTITGIGWSDEGGITLFVSVSEFWGKPLKFLFHERNDGWRAFIETDDTSKFFPGELRVLD
jgi:hypothetical protein